MPKQKEISKYVVFDVESHEFDLVVTKYKNKLTLELFYSSNAIWREHVRNTSAMKIVSNGNNIKLSKKFKKLKYDEASYLRFLLNFENYIDTNNVNQIKYKVINSETTIEI